MAGILVGFYFNFPLEILLVPGILVLFSFIFSYFRAKRLFLQDLFFGLNVLLIFFFIGILAASLHLPKNKPNHYVNFLPEASENIILRGRISEKLKPGHFQEKFILKAVDLNGKPVSGKVLLNITSDSLAPSLQIGDEIVVGADLIPINSPLNPHQFNYRKYMEDLGVLRQINAKGNEVLITKTGAGDLRSWAGTIRFDIITGLRSKDFKPDELAIIQALLLGQRQEVSQEIYSNYSAAGVIHILAVSGLHVGIILLLLNQMLQPLERFPSGKIVKTILILLLMWGFAVLAGLSPSVVRAVSMFSFVAVGMQLNRRTSILNTLFMSLLVLLLINPGFINQVGFQLSYAAVFSIVLIQPHLFEIYKGDSRLIKYFWGIFTVTLAAQIGVLPLSLFYFHQFPGLFFLSNLVILPFLGIILGVGIIVLLLALLNLLPNLIAESFGWMISLLNKFVAWAASHEDFIFQNIGFSLLLCISSYLVIIAFIFLLKDLRFRTIILFLSAILIFQSTLFFERFSAEETESVIFHKSRNTVIGDQKGGQFALYHNLGSDAFSYSFIKDYSTSKNIKGLQEGSLRNVYKMAGKTILQIDSSGIYEIPGMKPEIILLTNSARINMERMLNTFSPEIIVADGSNFPSLVRQWKETAANKKIPFHATGEKGAFIFRSSSEESKVDQL